MRIAIISDIHGNIHALEAVLADVEQAGADELIVNGDLVNRGPNNSAVMERLMTTGARFVMGNHDDLMLKWVDHDPDIPASWYGDPFWLGTSWSAEQLVASGWLDALRDFPMTHKIIVPGAPPLLVSHGSPRHYREGYGHFLKDEQISEIVQDYPYEILIGSHTHRQMERRWGKHLLLNSGAVGAPFNRDPRAQYLMLTLRGGQWEWEFRAVPYDWQAALRAYETEGYLAEGGVSARIFFEELRYARALYAPYWMWSETHDRPRNWDTWREFSREYGDRLFQPVSVPVGPPSPDRPGGNHELTAF